MAPDHAFHPESAATRGGSLGEPAFWFRPRPAVRDLDTRNHTPSRDLIQRQPLPADPYRVQFERYRDLIQRLEVEAAHDPRGFAVRVGLLGVLGYAYILGVFALLTAVLIIVPQLTRGSMTWLLIKPGLLAVVIAAVLLRVLIVRVDPPRGIVLARGR